MPDNSLGMICTSSMLCMELFRNLCGLLMHAMELYFPPMQMVNITREETSQVDQCLTVVSQSNYTVKVTFICGISDISHINS